jgi:hypothetical protein
MRVLHQAKQYLVTSYYSTGTMMVMMMKRMVLFAVMLPAMA